MVSVDAAAPDRFPGGIPFFFRSSSSTVRLGLYQKYRLLLNFISETRRQLFMILMKTTSVKPSIMMGI